MSMVRIVYYVPIYSPPPPQTTTTPGISNIRTAIVCTKWKKGRFLPLSSDYYYYYYYYYYLLLLGGGEGCILILLPFTDCTYRKKHDLLLEKTYIQY
jgi:hypothetical protein